MSKYKDILVVNALNGILPLQLRKKYPRAKIICGEHFNHHVPHLEKLGFQVEMINSAFSDNRQYHQIVGNPPYQNGENSNFYKQFIEKAKQHTDTLIFVVPATHFANLKNFKNISDYKYIGAAFKGVSVEAVWFIWRKGYEGPVKIYGHDNQTILVDNPVITPTNDLELFTFTSKIVSRGLPGYRIDSGGLSRNKGIITEQGAKCIWGAGKRGGDFDWVTVDESQSYMLHGLGKHKVVFSGDTASTYIGATKYADPSYGCGMKCRAIIVDNKTQAENLIQYLNSKFVKTMIPQLKGISTGNSNRVFGRIPRVDLDRSWTDEQIYAHFKLTKKEIAYIERKNK